MNAEILCVGGELLVPGKLETNSIYLTEKLAEIGIPVVFRAVVGDDEIAIGKAIAQALGRASVVLVTGGLGPTSDDRTREGACRALGRGMTIDEGVLERLRDRFARRGISMPEVNRRQASVVEGSDVLPNRVGTAPGLWIRAGPERVVVLLPGPPAELQSVVEEHVLPRLAAGKGEVYYRVRKLWIAGVPESAVEQEIAPTYREVENPSTAILASAGQVEVRLTARGGSAAEADAANEELAKRLRAILGDRIFSEAEESLEEVVGRLLSERRLKITVAESITGGLIAHRITEVPGSSRYFERAFVTYSNEAKSALLGVPSHLFETVGAVSEEVARAMALGARERARSDLALAATGIAGPSGGSPRKPVGLVFIALATGQGERVERFQFPGRRQHVKRWTSQAALNMARLELLRSRGREGSSSEH